MRRANAFSIGWEEQQAGAGGLDQHADAGTLVAGQVVHDHNVAAPEVGHEHLADITDTY